LRSLVSELEQRLGVRIPLTCRALPWIVHMVGFLVTRFNRGQDNTTPYFRMNGAHYTGNMCLLGETVMIKVPKGDSRFRSHWRKGVWLGKSETNDENFVGTESGVVSGRSCHRLPDIPFEVDRILAVAGVPWASREGLEGLEKELKLPPPPVPVSIADAPPELIAAPIEDKEAELVEDTGSVSDSSSSYPSPAQAGAAPPIRVASATPSRVVSPNPSQEATRPATPVADTPMTPVAQDVRCRHLFRKETVTG
jgi:hypothetical protein